MTHLKFHNTDIEIIEYAGLKWLRSHHIGGALGLARPSDAVQKIYKRNKSEFTDDMTAVIPLPSEGGRQSSRIYSARGAALIAMKAQTDKAAEFRAWVLDVLEGKHHTEAAILERELERVREAHSFTADLLCAANPVMAQIRPLAERGMTIFAISQVLRKSEKVIKDTYLLMQDAGILTVWDSEAGVYRNAHGLQQPKARVENAITDAHWVRVERYRNLKSIERQTQTIAQNHQRRLEILKMYNPSHL